MTRRPVTIFHLDVPLRSVFETTDAAINSRSTALVRLGDGPFGWGESAPFPGQDEPLELAMRSAVKDEWTPTLRAALDEAAADLEARELGIPLSHGLGDTSEAVPVSLAVGLSDPIAAVEHAVDHGVSRFKLKIAPGRIEQVAAIRGRFADISIGVDANGSFNADTAKDLRALDGLGVAYLEQPFADLEGDLARSVRSALGVPLFADESVRSVADADALLSLDHVDGVVVKPGRLGWRGSLAVRESANAHGKRWRASGLLETGIGRAYTDTLAACSDAFPSDVAPADWFMESDVAAQRCFNAQVTVPTGPGLGVEPIAELLERYMVDSVALSA